MKDVFTRILIVRLTHSSRLQCSLAMAAKTVHLVSNAPTAYGCLGTPGAVQMTANRKEGRRERVCQYQGKRCQQQRYSYFRCGQGFEHASEGEASGLFTVVWWAGDGWRWHAFDQRKWIMYSRGFCAVEK